jgi:hypothetical protein
VEWLADSESVVCLERDRLPDGSAVVSTGDNSSTELRIVPANGDAPFVVELTGESLPDSDRNFLGWESDTVFLVYVGFGFQIEAGDVGLWAVDVATGEVTRRW